MRSTSKEKLPRCQQQRNSRNRTSSAPRAPCLGVNTRYEAPSCDSPTHSFVHDPRHSGTVYAQLALDITSLAARAAAVGAVNAYYRGPIPIIDLIRRTRRGAEVQYSPGVLIGIDSLMRGITRRRARGTKPPHALSTWKRFEAPRAFNLARSHCCTIVGFAAECIFGIRSPRR